MDQGNCSSADQEVYFGKDYPDSVEKHAPSHPSWLVKFAKRLCQPCPVREQCLMFAIENEETYGVWGGMTPRERQRYQRRLQDR